MFTAIACSMVKRWLYGQEVAVIIACKGGGGGGGGGGADPARHSQAMQNLKLNMFESKTSVHVEILQIFCQT